MLYLILALGLILSAIPTKVPARQAERQAATRQPMETEERAQELLPSELGENWRAIIPEQTLKPDQWAVLPDADVYGEYGLKRLISRIYSNGKHKITVEAFEMRFTSGAYGLFTFNRGRLSPNRREFYSGRYLISMAGDHNVLEIEPSMIESLKKVIPGSSDQFPFLPSHLPRGENKIADSEKYIVGPYALARLQGFSDLKEVVKFDGGVEVVTADYRNGNGKMGLIIVEYHTPQLASDGFARASKYYDLLSQNEKERRTLKRIGNYVVQTANITDRSDAEKIVSQIKYNPKIYWEGRKLGDVPVEFRQPDSAAIEEATETMQVLVRSFYWISTLLFSSILVGFIMGGALFYWKRYRRRKLGIDDIFADSGDTVRLNLDDYLLQTEDGTVSQIGQIGQIGQISDGKE